MSLDYGFYRATFSNCLVLIVDAHNANSSASIVIMLNQEYFPAGLA